jgi:hypothetical protein
MRCNMPGIYAMMGSCVGLVGDQPAQGTSCARIMTRRHFREALAIYMCRSVRSAKKKPPTTKCVHPMIRQTQQPSMKSILNVGHHPKPIMKPKRVCAENLK